MNGHQFLSRGLIGRTAESAEKVRQLAGCTFREV
jgi:hypothetical protein